MSRRRVYEKLFDADPGWLGPKYLKAFWTEPDWNTRWQMIQQARNGGSMTPAILTQLRRLQRGGKIAFYEQCQVSVARWSGEHWQVCCNNSAVHECIHDQGFDRIWLATGSQLDATTHPLLKQVLILKNLITSFTSRLYGYWLFQLRVSPWVLSLRQLQQTSQHVFQQKHSENYFSHSLPSSEAALEQPMNYPINSFGLSIHSSAIYIPQHFVCKFSWKTISIHLKQKCVKRYCLLILQANLLKPCMSLL